MFNAMLITEDNVLTVKKILNIPNLPLRYFENPTWLIWTTDTDQIPWTLPHRIFFDRYTIVGNTENHSLVERI